MTDKELIEAQENDIRNLLASLREKDVLLEQYKDSIPDRSRYKYKYDTPYFRIDSYNVYCYALCSFEEYHWENHGIYPYYRFTELFTYGLSDQYFGQQRNGVGGRRSFKTCISYDDLMKKLDRRVRINYKGKGSEYAKLIKDIQNELIKYKTWFSDFFTDVEEE